jgi:ElaB/YqjD/DUF883 family membrane-anchored ribosome-binding protein/flagellar hook-basal body complex protein FliE
MGSPTRAVTRGRDSSDEERDSDEIEAAIERSRAEIGHTLEALHGRLNPRVLKEELLQQLQEGKEAVKADLKEEYQAAKVAFAEEFHEIKDEVFTGVKAEVTEAKAAIREATLGKVETMLHETKESVQHASHSLRTTIKENPVPAVLVGAGVLWMVAASRAKSHGTVLGDEVRRVAHQAGDAVKGAAHAAGEKVEGMAQGVKESVGEATRATGRELSHLADRVGATGSTMTERTETMFHQHPLAVGAAVLGLGALLGMAIPMTRKEAELMGDARQSLADRAEDLAADARSRFKQGVERVTNELKKGADGQDGPATNEA